MKKLIIIFCAFTLYALSFSPMLCMKCVEFMPPEKISVAEELKETKKFKK